MGRAQRACIDPAAVHGPSHSFSEPAWRRVRTSGHAGQYGRSADWLSALPMFGCDGHYIVPFRAGPARRSPRSRAWYAIIPDSPLQPGEAVPNPSPKGPCRGRNAARLEPGLPRGPGGHARRGDRLLRWEHGRAAQLEGRRARYARAHGRLAVGRGARLRRRDLCDPGRECPRERRPERDRRHPARECRRVGRAALCEHRRPRARRAQRPRVRPRRAAVVHRFGHRAGRSVRARRPGAGAPLRIGARRRGRVHHGTAGRLPERDRLRRPEAHVLDRVRRASRLPARRRQGDGLVSALRRACPRRDGLRGRRTRVRVHHDLGRRDRALGRRRGARGDPPGRARHQLHLRRLGALRDSDRGGRDPRGSAHRHVLAGRDRRDAACR